MAYEFPTQIESRASFLLGVDIGEAGSTMVNRLRSAGLYAQLGLTAQLLRSLSTISYEKEVREFCPKDATSRFSTPALGEEWVSKGRAMVTISDDLGKVVAYGWSGPEKNEEIPQAPITTAYRVGKSGANYARNIRENDPTFRMGYALGTLVVATAQLYGAQPDEISLETWKSNKRAISLYEDLGFELYTEKLELKGRPTLHMVGEEINGYTVFEHTDPITSAVGNRVFDTRCFYQYSNVAA